MYTSFLCFADDAQKRYWSVLARLRLVVLFKDVCVKLASFQEEGKYPSERERLKMTAYGCAEMCKPYFTRGTIT